ncbi:hypothetical protein Sta7437_0665 [Stanieria cyanosphaera PCC 7437]|uniref:Uncharacterized protein n=1 Tax=Stanieria cyanosphaera (strain ATCC 29371 / PCC 7437) TaxID=111780 RepID=K9XNS2_STAC7|nr:hypothetical protein [Stanieria cyanosphaera]AFZ34260.1 hypothetical protein Sta7437_0665 [Stanieria cyanosphaera PCC 7437]
MFNNLVSKITASTVMFSFIAIGLPPAIAQSEHHHQMTTEEVKELPPVPQNLPKWMNNKDKNHIYRKRGKYNDDIYNVRPLALDLNAVAVGHAFAYEDLITGKADQLETKTFEKINQVLKNPPRFMPDEANISPTFGRKYGVLEQVFEWAHILHAQTVDVLASTELTEAEKEAEIEALYQFYLDNVPYAITGLPMNMGYLDSQPYSKAFRDKYPKVNGLFWGYHWLQGSMYDLLYGKTLEEQQQAYEQMGKQYHEVELYRTDRPFMPMFAEVSPRFAARFPKIANTFDNLHMLHDMVNDALASEWMSEKQQEEQIQRAIWLVMASNHEGMEAGKTYGDDKLHDHRFMAGMPGMGWMGDIEGYEHLNHRQNNPHIMHQQMNQENNSEIDRRENNPNMSEPEEDHTKHNH